MGEKVKKLLSLAGLGIKVFVLVVVLLYVSLGSENVRSMTILGADNVSYVLVNEDLGAVFNGVQYHLGSEFVTLISQDTENRWQVASRTVAEAGFRSGSFDVMIILPQNFSERLLSLQSFTPEQAEIVFEVRHGQNELANMAINAQVTEILNTFNEQIVQMYFSSVLGSLFDAQLEVGVMVDGESNRHHFFTSHVSELFTSLPQEFSRVFTQSSTLQDQTENWRLGHDSFTETTEGLLVASVEEFQSHAELLTAHSELMSQIGETNIRNTRIAMQRQSETDEAFYKTHFTALHETAVDRMDRFFYEDEEGARRGLLSDFMQNAEDFQENQGHVQGSLRDQIEALNEQVEELDDFRGRVADVFFGARDRTPPEDADHDDIFEAIRALIDEDNYIYDPLLNEVYLDVIRNYIEGVPTGIGGLSIEAIRGMLEELHQLELIEDEQIVEYGHQLDIIERFADEEEVEFDDGVEFQLTDFDEDDAIAPILARYRQRVPDFSIHPNLTRTSSSSGTAYTASSIISLRCDESLTDLMGCSNAPIEINNRGAVALEIQQAIEADITHSLPLSVTVTSGSSLSSFNVYFTVSCTADPDEVSGYSCPVIPENLSFDIKELWVELNWLFSDEERSNMFNRRKFTWVIDSSDIMVFELSHFFRFVDISDPVINDLSVLLDQVQRIERVSRQIVTLFGPPEKSGQTVTGFLQFLEEAEADWESPTVAQPDCDPDEDPDCDPSPPSSGSNEPTIRMLAHPDSIYHRYGDMTPDARAQFIFEALHEGFHEQGRALHGTATTRRNDLMAILGNDTLRDDDTPLFSLTSIHHRLPDPESLLNEVDALRGWHTQSVSNLRSSYDGWRVGQIIEFELRENFGSIDTLSDRYIYFNTQSAEGMLGLMGTLVSSMYQNVNSIVSGSAELISLDDDFESMVGQTGEVYGQLGTILENVDTLGSEFYENVNANLAYAENFATVMENARIGGVDNPEVLNFLPRPVSLVETQSVVEQVSIIPYYMTVISAMLNFSAGYGLRYFWKKREQTVVDELVNRSVVWKNTPFVLKLIPISLAIGLIFSGISLRSVNPTRAMTWMMYVPLLITLGILIIAYLARQFPKASLFIIGAVIATYLLLNPVLGIQIEPGTMVDWLFNFSPLQNVENMFARLIAGDFISISHYVLLISLVGLGVLLNLLVTEGKTKSIEVTKDEA